MFIHDDDIVMISWKLSFDVSSVSQPLTNVTIFSPRHAYLSHRLMNLVTFRYITGAITPDEALGILYATVRLGSKRLS